MAKTPPKPVEERPERDLSQATPFGWRPSKSGVNYSKAEVALQLEEIGKRIALCHSHSRIARDLGLPRDRVIIRARQIEAIWRENAVKDREILRIRQQQELRAMREKLWEDWEKSREDAETNTTAANEGGEFSTKTTTSRYGDPAIAAQIRATIETEAKLFGTNAPDVVEFSFAETVEAALAEGRARVAKDRERLARPN